TASQSPAVTIERSDADQGGNLFAIEFSEFWQLSNKTATNNRTNAGHSSEQVLVFLPDWTVTDALVEIFVGPTQFRFQPADVSVDAFFHRFGNSAEPVVLGHNHFGDLSPAGNQCAQLQGDLIGQGTHSRAHRFSE